MVKYYKIQTKDQLSKLWVVFLVFVFNKDTNIEAASSPYVFPPTPHLQFLEALCDIFIPNLFISMV